MTTPPLEYLKQHGINVGGNNPPGSSVSSMPNQSTPQGQVKMDPMEYLRRQQTPVEVKQQNEDVQGDGQDYPNEPGFFHQLGSFIKYAATAMPDVNTVADTYQAGAKQMFQNISSDISNAIDYYKKTPLSQVGGDAIGMVKDGASQASMAGPGNMAMGLLKGFVEKPIEAITGTVNDNGNARPATPQEQAISMQATAGLVAQIGAFKALKAGMLGTIPEGEAAVSAMNPLQLGKVTMSGGFKQGLKYIGAEGLAGTGSGAVQGAIAGIGQDDQHTQIISSALSMLPISAAMGIFGVKGYVNEIKSAKGSFVNESNLESAREIAAVNSLRIQPSDPISTLVNNVDAVSSADKMVHAAIRSKLAVGDGYIVDNVSPAVGKSLESSILDSPKTRPVEIDPLRAEKIKAGLDTQKDGEYLPPAELRKARPKPNSTEVKFDSPIDKVSYLAAGKNRTPYVQRLVDDLSNQTGLSDEEITAHGKYVKLQQKKLFKQETLIPRSQAEIDAYNNASVQNGQDVVNALPDGGTYKDNQGSVWIRKGNTVVSNVNGQDVALPIDQNNTLMQLGRKSDSSPFYRPYQNLETQDFNPNFGRVSSSNAPVKAIYGGNGSLMFTPKNYKPDILYFFKTHGFMPGEIVSANGVDGLVVKSGVDIHIQDLTSGVKQDYTGATDELRRTNKSLDAEVVQGVGVKAPTLTPENLTQHLYSKFLDGYKQSIDDYEAALKNPKIDPASVKEESFSDYQQRFFHDNGIDGKDFPSITALFTKKLGDDLASATLPNEELALRNKLGVAWMNRADQYAEDHSKFLSDQALGNGLFYSAEGSGKYRLRFQDSGKTMALVSTPEEALNAINSIRQSAGLDLDGGFTGIVPPGIGNRGGLESLYTPNQSGSFANRIDISRMGGILNKITPVGRVLQSVDNLMKGQGKESGFYPAFLKLQDVLINRKNLIERDPELKLLASKGQAALDFMSKIPSERKLLISDNVETMTIDQIKKSYLNRSMTPIEEVLADNMSKTGNISQIKDLLYKTRLANKNAGLGGSSFMTDLLEIGKLYDPGILKQAVDFVNTTSKFGKDLASGEGVMRLAEALEDPSKAIDPVEHARKNNLTPQELKAVGLIQDWYKQAAPVAGIDPKAQLQVYLPTIMRKVAGSFNGDLNINTEFAHEMSRLGISPRGELIRDPSQLISKYYLALINHKSGFYDAVSEFKDSMEKEIAGFKGTKLEGSTNPFTTKMDGYTREVYGYPDPSDALNKSVNEMAKQMGLKTINQNSVLNLMSLGLIAGRPALAIRDFHNIWGLAWTSFGNEFTTKFLTDAVNPEYVQALKDKNILPNSASQSIIDSSVDESSLINNNGWIRQWSNKGFKLSGQEFGYEHANAGIYQASMRMAEKYFEKIRTGEITKAEGFDKMGISSNYGPGMIGQIDDLLTKGRTDIAGDLYAKANMRYLSHVYGFHNNPMGWNSNFGRLLSQYGSWAANASSTFLDQVSRGSKKQIAGKIARIGMFNQATTMAGTALGFNLASWQISHPLTVWPGTGPLVNMWGQASQDSERGMGAMQILMKDASSFLPYSVAAKGWLRGLDALSNGNIAQAIGGIAGAPLDKKNQQ